jgi:hypothetical protein
VASISGQISRAISWLFQKLLPFILNMILPQELKISVSQGAAGITGGKTASS